MVDVDIQLTAKPSMEQGFGHLELQFDDQFTFESLKEEETFIQVEADASNPDLTATTT